MAGLFKLVLHSFDSNNPSNEFINVFGYRSNLTIADELNQLADSFLAQVLPDVKTVLFASTVFNRLEVLNVLNGVDYLDRAITPVVIGERGGDPMPQFVSWGFRYARLNAGDRSGAKRFSTISETDVVAGVATSAIQGGLDAVAAALAAPLVVGIIQTWFPEILVRTPLGTYPWSSHPISGVQYKRVTTQNSRKFT